MAVGAQGDRGVGAARHEQIGGKPSHLAVANHERAQAAQARELALGEVDGGAGARGALLVELHLRADGLAAGHGEAEEGLELRRYAAGLARRRLRTAHLGDDLVLPQHLGAQAAGDGHETSAGLGACEGEQLGHHRPLRLAVEREGQVAHGGGGPDEEHFVGVVLTCGHVEVGLEAVARLEQHASARAETSDGRLHEGGLGRLGDGEQLAHLHGGRLPVDANSHNHRTTSLSRAFGPARRP